MTLGEIDLLIKNGYLQSAPDTALIAEQIGSLVKQGFLEELPNHFFSFQNNLTWEVIYETLLYAEKRLLHNIIATHIEKHNQSNLDTVADMLLYHFEKSQNYAKCVKYGATAGEMASSLFANEDAISFYTRSINALEGIKRQSPVDLSLLQERIGDANENMGRHKEAITHYQKALDIWRSTSKNKKPKYISWSPRPSTYESSLARKIAMSLEHDAEYDQALKWLDEAEKFLPRRPGNVASQIAATKSATLFRKGEFEQAISFGKQALHVAKRSAHKVEEAYAHNMIANSYIQLGVLNKAVNHLNFAEKICVEIEDIPGIATASNNLGDCYYYLGDFKTAVTHYKNALLSDERMHNQSGITMGHFNLGNILVDIGDLATASSHLEEVIRDYKAGHCRRDLAAATYLTLCKCLRLQKQLDAALSAINESLNILKNDDQSSISNHAKLQLAELLIEKDDANAAKEMAIKILNKAREMNISGLELIADRVVAKACLQFNDFENASTHISNSIKLANKIGAEHEEALSIVLLTRVAIASNQITPSVRSSLERAIGILSKIGAQLDLAEANNLVNQLH